MYKSIDEVRDALGWYDQITKVELTTRLGNIETCDASVEFQGVDRDPITLLCKSCREVELSMFPSEMQIEDIELSDIKSHQLEGMSYCLIVGRLTLSFDSLEVVDSFGSTLGDFY